MGGGEKKNTGGIEDDCAEQNHLTGKGLLKNQHLKSHQNFWQRWQDIELYITQ